MPLNDQAQKLLTALEARDRGESVQLDPSRQLIKQHVQDVDEAETVRVLRQLGHLGALTDEVILGMLVGVLVARGLAEIAAEQQLIQAAAGLDHFVVEFGATVVALTKHKSVA